jgi:TetR/AcrR family transcriptional repressor of nem operon
MSNDRSRLAYTRQVEVYVELLARLVAGENQKSKRTKAIAALATLVGARPMARAVSEEKHSRAILKSAADKLKSQVG